MKVNITVAELSIMRILWREQHPLKVSEIAGELEQRKGWNKSTTNTLSSRLRNKGLIESTERSGVARYIPLVTEDDFILSEEKVVMEKFGDAKKLAVAMVRNGHLTASDIDELRDYIKRAGNG